MKKNKTKQGQGEEALVANPSHQTKTEKEGKKGGVGKARTDNAGRPLPFVGVIEGTKQE